MLLGSEYERFTLFTFSGIKGQTRVAREGLCVVSNKVTVVISSQNDPFILFLTKNIFQQGESPIGQLRLVAESAVKETDPEFTRSCRFICLSPILLIKPSFNSDVAKEFIVPERDVFSDLLFESTFQRMVKQGMKVDQIEGFQKFQLIPDAEYLGKIKMEKKKFSRIYTIYDRDVMFESRGYTIPFTLHAVPEVLSFLFTNGLGYYSHKGFGMIDLADFTDERKTIAFDLDSLKTA